MSVGVDGSRLDRATVPRGVLAEAVDVPPCPDGMLKVVLVAGGGNQSEKSGRVLLGRR